MVSSIHLRLLFGNPFAGREKLQQRSRERRCAGGRGGEAVSQTFANGNVAVVLIRSRSAAIRRSAFGLE